jgi:neuroblastoma-amplified sequence
MPIEIRLSKDRLSLVSRVLSSNDDAYKHVQVILELVDKLGFTNDTVAEVKTLAMLTDTALNVEDFDRAFETCVMMVQKVQALKAERSVDDPQVQQASEVCWVSCFQLGRHPAFDDTEKKTKMLGRAMELVPAETLGEVLAAWHRLETEYLAHRRERRRDGLRSASHRHQKRKTAETYVASTLASRLQQLHIPSSPIAHAPDAAALANKALHSVAANLPFGGRGRSLFSQQSDRSRSSSRYDGEVSAQATRVLQKGLGWLLGDEN